MARSFRVDFLGEGSFSVLEALLEKPGYLRELADRTRLAPSTVHKTLSKLVEKKMVFWEKQKNRKLFRLNPDSPLTAKALSLWIVNQIVESKSFGQLIQLRPRGVCLFGTAASGKLSSDSDVDLALFFETRPDSTRLSEIKRLLSDELQQEVQLVVLTPEKVQSMERAKTELLNQIRNHSIVLWGEMA